MQHCPSCKASDNVEHMLSYNRVSMEMDTDNILYIYKTCVYAVEYLWATRVSGTYPEKLNTQSYDTAVLLSLSEPQGLTWEGDKVMLGQINGCRVWDTSYQTYHNLTTRKTCKGQQIHTHQY